MVDLASMTDGPKERARNQGPASICGHPRLSSQEEGELQADMQYGLIIWLLRSVVLSQHADFHAFVHLMSMYISIR